MQQNPAKGTPSLAARERKPSSKENASAQAAHGTFPFNPEMVESRVSSNLNTLDRPWKRSLLKAGQGRIENPHPPHFAGSRWAGKAKCSHRAQQTHEVNPPATTSPVGRATSLQHCTASLTFHLAPAKRNNAQQRKPRKTNLVATHMLPT